MGRLPLVVFVVLLVRATSALALSPGLTDCGPMSGLSPAQLDFAAATALMSDETRGRVLGTDSDVRGMVNACARDTRIEACTAKGVMGLVSPLGAATDTAKGAAGGAVLGRLFGFGGGTMGGAAAGATFSDAIGLVETARTLKQCVEHREAMSRIADRLAVSPTLIDPGGSRLSYDLFLSILRENVASRRISPAEGNEMAVTADRWRKALQHAVN